MLRVSINNIGSWHKVQIIQINEGTSTRFINNEQITKPCTWETVILTIEKCFNNEEEAKVYTQTKGFKKLFIAAGYLKD